MQAAYIAIWAYSYIGGSEVREISQRGERDLTTPCTLLKKTEYKKKMLVVVFLDPKCWISTSPDG
jgi:hypothetical protein